MYVCIDMYICVDFPSPCTCFARVSSRMSFLMVAMMAAVPWEGGAMGSFLTCAKKKKFQEEREGEREREIG